MKWETHFDIRVLFGIICNLIIAVTNDISSFSIPGYRPIEKTPFGVYARARRETAKNEDFPTES